MKYLGISRAEKFSPNRTEADAAVFRAVVSELERHGNEVLCMTGEELVQQGIPEGIDGIFQMARGRETLAVLEKATVPVTNTVRAVINCGRAMQTEILQGSGLIPESLVCSTCGVPEGWGYYPCWIKRGDCHALEPDDVRFVRNPAECASSMQAFAVRGIDTCVLQRHVRGWVVKFYGIRGRGITDCYAASLKDGKFGLERFNDQPDQASVDMETLTDVAERASRMLNLDVFGGDAVVGPDGEITLIDFNDWPSFRTCTVGAAQKIAELITGKKR